MECIKCGKNLPEEAGFCLWCGAKQPTRRRLKRGKRGVYSTCVSVGGIRRTVQAKTEAECIRKAEQAKAALLRGEAAQKNLTVQTYAEQYVAAYHRTGSPYDETMTGIVRTIIIPALGFRRMAAITPTMLVEFVGGLNYGYWHTKKVVQMLRRIFRQAAQDRKITYDPAASLRTPKGLPCGNHRTITPEEETLIRAVAEYHNAGLYVLLMLDCGLRPQEAVALRWDDVDDQDKTIRIRQAVKKGGELGEPKSRSGNRVVPVPDGLSDRLRAARRPESIYVVSNDHQQGKPLTEAQRARLWANFLREADIKNGAKVYRNAIAESTIADDLTPYCLRHTYGTKAEAAGIPITVTRYLMGHSGIDVTARYYTHTAEDKAALDLAAQKLGSSRLQADYMQEAKNE